MSMADAKKMARKSIMVESSPSVKGIKRGTVAGIDLEAQLRALEKDAKSGKAKDGFATINTKK